MLYLVNPAGRRTRRRTAKQQAATRKMLAARKRSRKGKRTRTRARSARKQTTRTRATIMARKRRAAPRKRRRTAKRRAGTRLTRRGLTVYQGNPKRRRRRGLGAYRGNPGGGMLGQFKQNVLNGLAVTGGGAIARMASGLIPLADTGIAGAAKGLAVAQVLDFALRRVKLLSPDTTRFLVAGAMQVPIKTLITTLLPQASGLLGEYDAVGAYESSMGNYLDDAGGGALSGSEEAEFGEYVESY